MISYRPGDDSAAGEGVYEWPRSRVLALLTGLIVLVVAILLYSNYRATLNALKEDLAREAEVYADIYHSLRESAEKELVLVALFIASDSQIQRLLHAAREAVEAEGGGAGGERAALLRQLLHDLVSPRWGFAEERLQARLLNFHLAPGSTSFLRIDRPQRFGEDLSGIRFSVVDTNREGTPRSGFEIGRLHAALRAVVPVQAGSGDGGPPVHVGALETGLSFATIVETLKDVTGSDATILLRRSEVESVMSPPNLDLQNAGTQQGDWLIDSTSSPLPPDILDIQHAVAASTSSQFNSPQLISTDGRSYFATIYPLRDYRGDNTAEAEPIGRVVIWRDVSDRIAEFRQGQVWAIGLGVLAFVLVEIMMLVGFQRFTAGLRQRIRSTAKALSGSLTQRQFFEQILDNVEEAVYLANASGGLEYVNRAVVERLGYSKHALLGMTVGDVDADFDMRNWPAYWRELQQRGTLMFESLHRDSSGQLFPVEISANYIEYRGEHYSLGLVRDLSVHKRYQQELEESSERYRSIIETARDGFFMSNTEGRVLEVNDSYCRMTGFKRSELVGRSIADLEAREDSREVAAHIEKVVRRGADLFESAHRRKDGSVLPVEIAVSYSPVQGGRFYSFARDIEERKQDERLSQLRYQLSTLAHEGDVKPVLRAALDLAEELTDSEIAFYHFVDPGEEMISLQTWSTRTLNEMCATTDEETHYPVSQAGVWVDCVHQRRAVIHNDYASLPHRKGLPEGHATLERFISLPIFRDDAIVAIIGVGNKKSFYLEKDAEALARVGDMVYDFARHSETKHHVEYMAYHDVLTSLPNRELFFERFNLTIAQHARSGQLLALCYLDLDGFKPVNDEHGHDVGDQLLIRLGKRLQSVLREGDTIARLGGDEFVMLLSSLESAQEAEMIVKRLIGEASEPFDIAGKRLHVTASVGITLYPTDDTNPDTLLRHADQAMYLAKRAGKSQYRFYEVIEQEGDRSRRQIQQELREALKNDEFELYYQPRVNLLDGSVVGAEALIRWRHPQKGLLPPVAFLPHIEGTADEIALGEWVVRKALKQLAEWLEQGIDLPVSINISPDHIQKSGFAGFLREALSAYPADMAHKVELEILETSAIGDLKKVAEVMQECTETGVKFSLDDFGTGYSSLTYFHQLPISVLKIDQNFVRHMLEQAGNLEIVKGVIQLAKMLNRPVVAEGVENAELGFMLLDLGCQYAQGYGIARPMPAVRIPRWMDAWIANREWRDLSDVSSSSENSVELKVALYSHRRWQASVMKYLTLSGVASRPLVDDKQTEFWNWYKGIGRARFGDHPLFSFIPPRHRLVHKLARDLVNYVDNGDTNAALSMVEIFNNGCADLIDKLQSLDHD